MVKKLQDGTKISDTISGRAPPTSVRSRPLTKAQHARGLMSLRLMQIVLPGEVSTDLEDLVADHTVLGNWRANKRNRGIAVVDLSNDVCTVLCRMTLIGVDADLVLEVTESVESVLKSQDGFVSSTTLVREDRGEIISVLKWRDRECHENCRTNPEVMMAGSDLLEMVSSGAVQTSVDVYEEYLKS